MTKYWVVSPNVRNNEETVGDWRKASLREGLVFMGYSENDKWRGSVGPKFAYDVNPGDIVLIARRHNKKPEIVGFGIVKGKIIKGSDKKAQRAKPPEKFGTARILSPFQPQSVIPSYINEKVIMDCLKHTMAMRQLHPECEDHKKICDWMTRRLKPAKSAINVRDDMSDMRISSPKDNVMSYLRQTKAESIRAIKKEAKLVKNYELWLKKQDRKLDTVSFGKLRCDKFEKTRLNLIEAKGSLKRESIRMAVGQLLDYAFLYKKATSKNPYMAILVPQEPSQDLLEWLKSLEINVIWCENRVFLDNANGQFI